MNIGYDNSFISIDHTDSCLQVTFTQWLLQEEMPDFAIPTASGHACHGTSDLDAESMCLEGYGVLQNALLLVAEKP